MAASKPTDLIVDLDRVLLRTDLAYERRLASRLGAPAPDLTALPFDETVLESVRAARADGRKVWLLASDSRADAEAIATRLGLFDGVIEADDARRLKDGFAYVGRDPAKATGRPGWTTWLRALRVHQYVKNLLVFVPLGAAHDLEPDAFLNASTAFASFCLCASGVYVLNDLVDLSADRAHPTKCRRPFASGALPLSSGPPLIGALLAGAFVLALFLPLRFFLCLVGYLVLTTAYSFWLKRKMAADVVVLALLYTTRILAGGFATSVVVSEWLLAFSTFIFTALALMKRHVEIVALREHDLEDAKNRDYKRSDLPVIAALAGASAVNSVTVFALYLSSSAVVSAYSHPRVLWLVCPLLLYWLARALMMAHRGTMDDDPVAFALRDRISWLIFAGMTCVFLLAL
jgi:4-hydroxybenzoate polyprenyltransferase